MAVGEVVGGFEGREEHAAFSFFWEGGEGREGFEDVAEGSVDELFESFCDFACEDDGCILSEYVVHIDEGLMDSVG